MPRVLILCGGHLSTAPRVFKEASTLAKAGVDVIVRGVWHDETLVERDELLVAAAPFEFAPVLDLRGSGVRSALWSKWQRGRGRLAREQYSRWGWFSPQLLGYGARHMLAAGIKCRADLTIVHSEAGLWVGCTLRQEGLEVGVDFEDWFSEDLLPEDRAQRPIRRIKAMERELANNCKYCLATSSAMSNALADEYGGPKPTVVYNAFPALATAYSDEGAADRVRVDLPSLHWFSQTIGPGRGLELLCEALPYVSRPVEVHLRGELTQSRRDWLLSLIPSLWADKIFLHSTVANAELPWRIAEHDIGLALEVPNSRSRNLTVTNKLFQYLQAGLAVVATDTAGQREVMNECPGAGVIFPANSPRLLASSLNRLLDDSTALQSAKIASSRAGKALSWESQEQTLLDMAMSALARRRR